MRIEYIELLPCRSWNSLAYRQMSELPNQHILFFFNFLQNNGISEFLSGMCRSTFQKLDKNGIIIFVVEGYPVVLSNNFSTKSSSDSFDGFNFYSIPSVNVMTSFRCNFW